MSVGGACSTFGEPGFGVKWKMSENVYSKRKVAMQVMTIARICETVDADMVTGISGRKCDGR